jgi:hypothetical protein
MNPGTSRLCLVPEKTQAWNSNHSVYALGLLQKPVAQCDVNIATLGTSVPNHSMQPLKLRADLD